jgi:hypothetical protein
MLVSLGSHVILLDAAIGLTLPEVRQPTRNMADMKMLLNSLYAPPEVSLHLTTARWRFIPSARPFGARDVERGER